MELTPKLKQLALLLQKKSQQLNLFSKADQQKIASKHIPDALAVLDFWEFEAGERVADIGTGGGIPGLPLAVELPEVQFTLIDARAKKIKAVQEVADEMGLTNVSSVSGRFEDLAQEELRESFDALTARAVAPLPILLEYAAGFIKPGGVMLAWKSGDFGEELESCKKAQHVLNMSFQDGMHYRLVDGEERSVLIFTKDAELHTKYPRRNGMPKHKPL